MRTVPRRAAVAAVALAALVPSLAACGQGTNAQTLTPYNQADGVNATMGPIRVSNAVVVGSGDAAGGTGTVVMQLANSADAPDTLSGVTVAGASATSVTGTTAVPANGTLTVGGPGSTTQIDVSGLPVGPGASVTVTLAFANAGTVTVQTVVVPPSGIYASFSPTVTPSASASPSSS